LNFRVLALFFLVFVAGKGTVLSQETAIVSIIPAKPVVVAKGQTTLSTIRAKIKKGFHIQANPAADEFLIPTTLTIQDSPDILLGKPVYPTGLPYRLKGSSKDLLTYEGEVTIMLPFKVKDSAPSGKINLTGKLNYQPCDDRKCLFPRSVSIVIPLKIVRLP
jgi:DsbC/DsbD-like thiol-disulfide interchange protein